MQNMLLIEGLKKLGLSELEAKAYLALIERNTMTASEIAKISNLNRTTTYDILNNLMEEGLCSLIPGKVKKYRALGVDSLADQIIEEKSVEYKRINNQINDIRGEIKLKLKKTHEQSQSDSNPLDYIHVYRNPLQIHRKFVELYCKAQKEVLCFTKPPFSYATKKQYLEQVKAQFDATERKVMSRVIIEMPPENEAIDFFNMLEEKETPFGKYQEIRVADKLPIKLFIFDHKTCYFALKDPIQGKTSLTMLLTEHEAMAQSFSLLFEMCWEKARDYYVVNGKKYNPFD